MKQLTIPYILWAHKEPRILQALICLVFEIRLGRRKYYLGLSTIGLSFESYSAYQPDRRTCIELLKMF